MQELVFASGNAGKIRELHDMLLPLGLTVRAQGELGIAEVEETGLTFVENALLKARQASSESGLPAIADDSGLEVDHLRGAPGLYSARFAEQHGEGSGDAANIESLLKRLAGVPQAERRARFRSVIVLLRHRLDPAPLIAQGVWDGQILDAVVGDGGFGYDPVFASDDTGVAAATLDKQTKNRLSHRGKAVAKLLALLTAHA